MQTTDQSSFLPAGAESPRAAEIRGELDDDAALPALLVLERPGG